MVDKIDAQLDSRPDKWLEERAKLPTNKLNKIRTGKQFMRADEIWRISKALKVPVSWLLDDAATLEVEGHASLDVPAVVVLESFESKRGANSGNEPVVGKTKHSPRSKQRMALDE